MLKLQFADGSRESIWLVEKVLKIGSDPGNNLVINQPDIQAFHAQIIQKDDELYLKNLNPEYIVGVNDKRVNKAVMVKENDLIQLGETRLRIVHPSSEARKGAPSAATESDDWALETDASWATQSRFPIKGNAIIGRDPECDICVPVNHLSRQHARLTPTGGFLLIKDLDSTNGTFLNGEQITQGRAKPGDKVRFDVVTFTVAGPKDDENKTIVRKAPVASARPSPPVQVSEAGTETTAKPKVKASRKPTQHSVANGSRSTAPHLSHTVPGASAPVVKQRTGVWIGIGFALVLIVGVVVMMVMH